MIADRHGTCMGLKAITEQNGNRAVGPKRQQTARGLIGIWDPGTSPLRPNAGTQNTAPRRGESPNAEPQQAPRLAADHRCPWASGGAGCIAAGVEPRRAVHVAGALQRALTSSRARQARGKKRILPYLQSVCLVVLSIPIHLIPSTNKSSGCWANPNAWLEVCINCT